MLKVLLVDDEKLARKRLTLLLDELDHEVQVMDEAADGREAVEKIRLLQPDLVFLDIQMPELDGFDVLNLLGTGHPPIIFVTAYDEYALKAFDVHAVDYLLKPVHKDRLKQAVEKLMNSRYRENHYQSIHNLLQEHAEQKQKPVTKLAVNHKNEIHLLDFHRITYLEADGKLTWVYTRENKKYRTDSSLNELENRLENHSFLRIHRSFIVNLEEINKLEPWFKNGFRLQMNNGVELEVARRRTSALKKMLGM